MMSCLSSKEIDIERPELICIEDESQLTCEERIQIRDQNFNELSTKFKDLVEQVIAADEERISVNIE